MRSKVLCEAPENWKTVYTLIEQYRTAHVAPVDVMGCAELSLATSSAKDRRFHCLLGLVLSSQTKDQVTSEAMHRLHEHVKPESLTPMTLAKIAPNKLQELLVPVGFYRRKAEYMLKIANICILKYDGDIPRTLEELLELPGVGPKMVRISLSS